MKQKGKRKKDREGRHVIVKKYKSFVKSKRIFWKQGTDAKSLFSGITEIRMDEFIELMKEHNLESWVCLCKFPTVVSQCHKRDA